MQEREEETRAGSISSSLGSARPKFQPTQDYILVRPIERKKSESLIVISGEKYTQGEVVSVGPGKKNKKGAIHPLIVQAGDRITYGDIERGYDFYPKYEENGIEYRLLQEADVCFVIDPAGEEAMRVESIY